MPTFISTVQSDYVLTNNQDIVLLGTGSLTSNGGTALSSAWGNNDIRIAGTIAGNIGIAISGPQAQSTTITFSATASLFAADVGISLSTAIATITNSGSIFADQAAIQIVGETNGSSTRIVNTGLISSTQGILVSVNPSVLYNDVTLINRGTIIVSATSAYTNEHADGVDRITNFGVIDGSISTGSSGDVVKNYGSITGGVYTGGGTDEIDNTRSTDAFNRYNLGDGDDEAYLGMAEEVIDGGAGFDIVSYLYSSGVRVNLSNILLNTREAARDYYVDVEGIMGSLYYADTLIGDARANRLIGSGGNDVLSGGLGNDSLQGGADSDRLTGGLGNDSFMFELGEPGRDVITDFTNAAGNNDRFQIWGSGLAPGQIVSGQFRARTDNLAQDGDDLFIFRTTDKTLWYDADGNGGGTAIMLADLQASAVVTFSDIFILS